MKLLLDSFWRASLYCIHPRVIALSFFPLILLLCLILGWGYFFWKPSVIGLESILNAQQWLHNLINWISSLSLGWFNSRPENVIYFLAPVLLIIIAIPLLTVFSLFLISLTMIPGLVSLVSERRFPSLHAQQGGSLIKGIFWSLGSTLAAGFCFLLTLPLWLIPPLILILPPLIGGWLTYRVMTYDVLARHASVSERIELFKEHRIELLTMGVVCSYLGIVPMLILSSGAWLLVTFVVLVPLAVWIYALIFAFSSLWFSHYCLTALQNLRNQAQVLAAEAAEEEDFQNKDVQPVIEMQVIETKINNEPSMSVEDYVTKVNALNISHSLDAPTNTDTNANKLNN